MNPLYFHSEYITALELVTSALSLSSYVIWCSDMWNWYTFTSNCCRVVLKVYLCAQVLNIFGHTEDEADDVVYVNWLCMVGTLVQSFL